MKNLYSNFLIRRFIGSLLMLFIVMSIIFIVGRQIGDPARMYLQMVGNEDDVRLVRERMGLEDPIYVQYKRFVIGMVTLDFGDTFRFGASHPLLIRPKEHQGDADNLATLPLAAERLPATLFLCSVSIFFSIIVSIPLGMFAAMRPRTLGDKIVNVLTLAGVSIVEYWFAFMLIIIFAVTLGWFPTSGYGTFAHVFLPAFALSLRAIGRITQLTRSALLDEFSKPYVRAARGRGIPMHKICFIHALRNASIPIVTTIGDETINILTGVIIIETVFAWPGIGALTVDALKLRDLPLIEATIFLLIVMVLLVNFTVDLMYYFLNPRAKTTGK
jgi:peptide/nickel transport system permease protein